MSMDGPCQRKLYNYFRSSASYRVRIALAHKGLSYDYVPVNIMPKVSEQKDAAYKALNPQMRIPFYRDHAVSISQSPAILEYLEECFPDPPLLPGDHVGRALVRQMAALVGCDIHPLNNLSVLTYLKRDLGADDAAVDAWYSHWITQGFQALETLAAASDMRGTFLYGDSPTLADVYLVPQMWNARRFNVSLEAFPLLTAIDAAACALPAFADAAPEVQPDTPEEMRA